MVVMHLKSPLKCLTFFMFIGLKYKYINSFYLKYKYSGFYTQIQVQLLVLRPKPDVQ